MRTAQEAVHTNLKEARSIYEFVLDVCVKLGASRDELVPFEKYAAAAESLSRPASAARALNNGATNIERADKLVQLIAKQKGMSHPVIDAVVALVDARLEANRKKAA
jgi:ketopantoate reductase